MAGKTKNTKLIRSESNKVLGGVCGGLGDFFSFDPTIIRLIFVIITLLGGSGVLMYLILWLVIPSENQGSTIDKQSLEKNAQEIKDSALKAADQVKSYTQNYNPRMVFGLLLLGLGVIMLFDNLGIWHSTYLWKFWPLGLILLAVVIIGKEK